MFGMREKYGPYKADQPLDKVIFSMGGLSVFRRHLPVFASCKGCLSVPVPVLSDVEFST